MTAFLERQIKSLMLYRVVMITTLLLSAIGVEAVAETVLRINWLYVLIIGTYVLTLLYVLALRLLPARSHSIQASVQVALDLVIITGLVYLTGGGGSRAGFMLLYPMSVLSGSILVSRWRGIALAVVATLLYGSLLWAVRSLLIPEQALGDVLRVAPKQLFYSVFVSGVACATVATIGGYLAQTLKTVGAQLKDVSVQVADLQELNRLIVDSIQTGLVTSDPEGRVLFVNRYGEGILERRSAELHGTFLRDLFGSHEFDVPAIELRAQDEAFGRFELAYCRPAGEVLDLGVSVMPLGAEAGGFLVVFQDLTEIKHLERDVRVKEKLAAVGETAAQLAHEIRNPLGAISGSAQVLSTDLGMNDEQKHLLEIITRESKRLSDTLSHFLERARPGPLRAGPVDLLSVVKDAVELLRNAPEVRGRHRIELVHDDGPHLCLADAARMTQVFWNLARNGLEAMPRGGTLSVLLRVLGEEIVLSVRDEGRGMSSLEREKLFEPFRASSGGGFGIGLAIVYQIVKDHRGDIVARSAPGRGTEVEVRLPLLRSAPHSRSRRSHTDGSQAES